MLRRLALPLVLTALLMCAAASAQTDTPYAQAMARADEAKHRGDFPAMASAIRDALLHDEGNEYAWRSLAWARGLAGEWRDSLGVAEENVRRHGRTGWTLEQLAESLMGAGDFAGAHAVLEEIGAMAPETLGEARGAIEGTRRRMLDLTGQRRYRLHWKVDLGQEGPGKPPVRLLMPRWGDTRQAFEFTVSNAESYERVSIGPRDFLDVVQKPGEPFSIDATVTIRGFVLGHEALESAVGEPVPDSLLGALGPFQHVELFAPDSPLCSRVAGISRGNTPARTVQNILNWMRDHMHYEDTPNRTVDTILAGGQGVCHHYCSSFTALCRSAGIPARVAHGVVLEGEGAFTGNQGSHGWASVWLGELGWVPVDPLDANSLALFGRSNYLLTDYANEEPGDDHFAYRSIQGFTCDGEVLALEPQG